MRRLLGAQSTAGLLQRLLGAQSMRPEEAMDVKGSNRVWAASVDLRGAGRMLVALCCEILGLKRRWM